ncbi:BlaI/MecI/CopY family transcriptional regulator [uncultured Roseivirga sp.]|jgi:predicted transcriptional regulator|uniref:BlaI/MecI/CopY family transcriptional regulator n=1 Tax=Roseivirga TaxID=290180 RepID=UPI002EBBF1C8|nr:BlaI/MecI/CopY family transcriptional regulator [Bacteroidota bacterium]|tara:strand:- start:98 stop:475 length:378 start_codon:yes stop_codon:yes gene_type:complete
MIKPTESELEILNILWTNGPSSVREVNKKINEQKEVGYTTTLKLMQIMTQKGLVERDESSRSHIYSARIKAEDIQEQMLDKLLNTAFGGSASKLVLSALGSGKASARELEEIKALIQKLEQDGNQ